MSIIVKNLTHVYSKNSPFERTAIKDVTFTIEDGEFIGLIGHTGSGKSTLIEHLNGLIKPESGTIIIDGEDITAPGCNMSKIRSKVGLVFQYPEYQLFEETVYKDIAYGPSNMGLTDDEIKRRVFEAADFVGISGDLMDKSPFELSIAGILAMEPTVLILDEPTAGLDPVGRNDIISRLKKLHKEKRTTIIIVSHSMEDIADTVEKVMVMSRGSLVLYDTCAKVFARAELLKSIGLDRPQICSVIDFFRERGYQVPEGIYNVEKIADIAYDIIEGAKNA